MEAKMKDFNDRRSPSSAFFSWPANAKAEAGGRQATRTTTQLRKIG
jgi:hypothetical protein